MQTQESTKVRDPQQTNPPVHTPADVRAFRHVSLKARRRRKRIVTLIIVILLLVLAAVPCYRYLIQPYQAQSVYQQLSTLYGTPGSGSLPANRNQELGALYDINPDVAGWLIVPDTDINLPVVLPKQHDSIYYVNHLFDGTPGTYGTPYFLTDPSTNRSGYQTVVRGGRQLMGQLEGYLDLSFYKKAPLLFLDTLYSAHSYKIFAVVELPDDEVSEFTDGRFADSAAFLEFVNEMATRSVIETGVTVSKSDSLLTLLCDTEQGKLAVIGRAVREDEDFAAEPERARLHTPGEPLTVTETDAPKGS